MISLQELHCLCMLSYMFSNINKIEGGLVFLNLYLYWVKQIFTGLIITHPSSDTCMSKFTVSLYLKRSLLSIMIDLSGIVEKF